VVSPLYVSGIPSQAEAWVLNGSFFVGADGVVHSYQAGADKVRRRESKEARGSGIDVYRRKNRMAVANLDGTWKPLDLLD
jgi:hypothetical protein